MNDRIEYLEEERKKLWTKIIHLEDELSKKTSDYEKEAKQASRKASEYRNRTKEAKETSEVNSDKVKTILSDIEANFNKSKNTLEEIQEIENSIGVINSNSENEYKSIQDKLKEVKGYVSDLEEIFEDHEDLKEEINSLESSFDNGEELLTKIEVLYKGIQTKKKEIDKLYYDIIGYVETDEDTGEEIEVDGLKDKLDRSYIELESKIKKTDDEVKLSNEVNKIAFENFVTKKKEEYQKINTKWENNFIEIKQKIENLLPQALTAGLSYAYSNKKTQEQKDYDKLIKRFNWGIGLMIGVSLIPFAISIHALLNEVSLEEVILRIPRVVLAILPIYVPILWLTYSASTKMNLSKRLIEEYSHKEALSKTFEGLSTQITNLKDEKISSELRTKLLYNILEVSSENPGKLISDYNKADHPLMDALDKSVKLANAVASINNIPGLSKFAKILGKKSEKIIDTQAVKIEEVLDGISDNGEEINNEKLN